MTKHKVVSVCRNCLYYHGDKYEGQCREAPPSAASNKWASVDGGDWCGHYKDAEDGSGLTISKTSNTY